MRKPLLRSRHFSDSITTFTRAGVGFDAWIDPDDRELSLMEPDESDPRWAERPPTHLVANPRKPTAAALLASMKRAQRGSPTENISVGYCQLDHCVKQGAYERRWLLREEDDHIEEGQGLVLVAFVGSTMR